MGPEMIMVILTSISLLIVIIASWVRLNVKFKEFELQLLGMETRLDTYKSERDDIMAMYRREHQTLIDQIEKSNDKLWGKLESIDDKLDIKFEQVIITKTELDIIKENCIIQKNKK